MTQQTNAFQQYQEAKQAAPDVLLLFRMGDFYEALYDDAPIVARTLGLTLASRNRGDGERVPMCGFPYHQIHGYVTKLVKTGYRVSVNERP